MKLLLISDVHASIDALNAVWAQESDADAIMCAGDIIDWGFHPHEVIAFMKEHNVICVHGNHDLEILEHIDAGHHEEKGKETNFATYIINQLTEDDVAWLRALPETQIAEFDGITYCMRHAIDPRERENAVRELLGQYRSIPAFSELWQKFVGSSDQPMRRLLLGHSHNCYTLQAAKNEMYINPGSVHYRLGPNAWTTGADYITVTDGVPTMKHVDYPTAHLKKMLEQSNFRDDVRRTATPFNSSVVD